MSQFSPISDSSSSPNFDSDWSYETTVIQVEQMINQIESGNLDLAEVFSEFASAVEHLRQCEAFLAQQQQQMDLLIETLTDESDAF